MSFYKPQSKTSRVVKPGRMGGPENATPLPHPCAWKTTFNQAEKNTLRVSTLNELAHNLIPILISNIILFYCQLKPDTVYFYAGPSGRRVQGAYGLEHWNHGFESR